MQACMLAGQTALFSCYKAISGSHTGEHDIPALCVVTEMLYLVITSIK